MKQGMYIVLKRVEQGYSCYNTRTGETKVFAKEQLLTMPDVQGVSCDEITEFGSLEEYRAQQEMLAELVGGITYRGEFFPVGERPVELRVFDDVSTDMMNGCISDKGVLELGRLGDNTSLDFKFPKDMQHPRVIDCSGMLYAMFENFTTVSDNNLWDSCSLYSDLEELHLSFRSFTVSEQEFQNAPKLRVVVVSDFVGSSDAPQMKAYINRKAFYACRQLETVNLTGVTMDVLADNIFYCCDKLHTVSLPKGLTTIKYNAFQGCKSLKQIELPETLKTIEAWAFAASGLVSVKLPKNVVSISNCFYECKDLLTVDLRYIKKIPAEPLFTDCTSLQEVILGENLSKFSPVAFEGCKNLKEVRLPAHLRKSNILMGATVSACCPVFLISRQLAEDLKLKDESGVFKRIGMPYRIVND